VIFGHAFEDSVSTRAEFRVSGGEADGYMHDADAGGTRFINQGDGVAQHAVRLHDGLDGIMEGAARGGEVVLVLDEDDRRGFRIQGPLL
jgi:hypothetical protein